METGAEVEMAAAARHAVAENVAVVVPHRDEEGVKRDSHRRTSRELRRFDSTAFFTMLALAIHGLFEGEAGGPWTRLAALLAAGVTC